MTVQAYLEKVDAVNAAGRYKPDWDSLSRHRAEPSELAMARLIRSAGILK